jgi:mRNA-degrading endonuclease toxin of MazEF toxin-antitoxin module
MPVRRGVAYRALRGSKDTYAALVVTNDDRNAWTQEVGVLPLRLPSRKPSLLFPVVSETPPLQAFPGSLVAIPKDDLGAACLELDDEQMAQVEDALCEILGLPYLCQDVPRQPPSVPGRVTYPRWGEIYYVKKLVGTQYKRWVVVSTNAWNKPADGAIGVRTTTGQGSRGADFPSIEDGNARAVCGAATYLPTRAYDMDGANRPWPERLDLADMAAVAQGLVMAYQLQSAVERARGLP